ncbi:hypothetical protein RhiirA5_428059 [Rhizophagus irregularis]|uniref:Uncharacterized protein n=1 Tax=Rhizophagus irregularis TaxID=588596 RepID=A0A2N0P148_9GLOM|nr:hypothetical protein RhiirA5_428059 [Rhizophagus irregularis]
MDINFVNRKDVEDLIENKLALKLKELKYREKDLALKERELALRECEAKIRVIKLSNCEKERKLIIRK